MSPSLLVSEFHRVMGSGVFWRLRRPNKKVTKLRRRLIKEEAEECREAFDQGDIYALGQELADLVYVTYGTALEYGIDLDAALREVHRANMAKVWPDGTIHKRKDGKAIKPPGWRPPDMRIALGSC